MDLSIHAEYTSNHLAVEAVAAYAKEHNARTHVHISETESEHEECKKRHDGKTPVRYFSELGMFDVPATAAHCVWIEGDDFDILKEKGVTVAVNPVSNLKLASGVADVMALVKAGMNVCLGTDGDASITYPDLSLDHDLYGVPNVVEVSWSDGFGTYSARAVNEDPGSPTSTVRRGREVVHRESDPEIGATPSQSAVEAYAASKLRELSAVEYEVSYKHGYNGVRLGDCVRLDLARAGLRGVRAVVTRQVIACEEGCPVEERAVVSERLW